MIFIELLCLGFTTQEARGEKLHEAYSGLDEEDGVSNDAKVGMDAMEMGLAAIDFVVLDQY